MDKVVPFLWFDEKAEEAAEFYVSLLPDSKVEDVTHYGEEPPGWKGKVMTVSFRLAGQPFIALNGGPSNALTEAFSILVHCEDQEEVDELWDKLTANGGEPGPCGWLKDRFGVSWQIVPTRLFELIGDPDREKAARATHAMLQMGKIDIAGLERAAAGEG
jgi:predicted 3-demethylubiquinone-9 3-methyltransferase (glyoxalase superfamily)